MNACDKTVGIPISKTQSLLLFAVDDRPSLDNLAGVLIDMTSGKVLDTKMNLGAFSHEKEIKIEKSKYGFRALMVQGWNKAAKSDSIAEAYMGRVSVKIKDGRILPSWENLLPKTHIQY